MTKVSKRIAGIEFVAKLPSKVVGGETSVSAEDAYAMEIQIGRELIRRGVVNAEAFSFVRKVAKLKAADLAEMLGVDTKTISRWETGEVKVPRPEWAVLATLFGERVQGQNDVTIVSVLRAAASPNQSQLKPVQLSAL